MYIKLVIAVGSLHPGQFLAQAPAFSYINPGDEVMVKYANTDEHRCRVINEIDVSDDSEEFKFIMDMSDVKTLPKVVSKVSYCPLEYNDDKANADMVE